ncbi:MAG: 5'-nucleotidase, lipoprotein e(P4) family [Candidatus Kapabacteria bacterium]|jgi:5'-nucleotidase (lipoprotein e(P4) family)|nr:5'-nucleotidase, lipoprotein e(P4) family [Candidatus Kapabacteria bacterium]
MKFLKQPFLHFVLAALIFCGFGQGLQAQADFSALERLAPDDRKLADSLLAVALDHEALYTLWGDLKPISDVATFTFRIARPLTVSSGTASVVDANSPAAMQAIQQLRRLQRVVNAMDFGDVQFFIHPFKRADSVKRFVQVAVLRKSSLEACLRRNQAFFGQFGFVPESDAVSVVMATEYEDKYERYRGYGYLYGYPEHAVTFFVEAARSQDSTKEFVKRDFFQIPTWSGKQGHFVYAVPKGYTATDTDSAIYYAASKVLSDYREIRPTFMNADSSLRAVELLRTWYSKQSSKQASVSLTDAGHYGILWAQSAEAKALYLQAFSLAQERLEAALQGRSKRSPKKPAVVVDIDETVLDNSPFNAAAYLASGGSTGKLWREWEQKGVAKSLPGAVEFLQFADKRSVQIFYISNRSNAAKQATMRNLREAGFPQVSAERVLLRDSTAGGEKESRRQAVAATHDILLLAGDNLGDFSAELEYKSLEERMNAMLKARTAWGKRFIILPNAMYGQWEDALYDYKRLPRWSEQDRLVKILYELGKY